MSADGLRLALGTLTAIPVRPPARLDRPTAGRAMLLAPLVMLPVAAVAAAVVWFGGVVVGLPGVLVGGLAVGFVVLANRAMHLDGLADTVDGLAASYDREHALDVMRRGNVGPSGTAAVCLVVVVDAGAISGLASSSAGAVLVGLSVVVSRSMVSWACERGVPAARSGGLGHTVAGSVSRAMLVAGSLVMVMLAAGLGVVAGQPWWVGPLCYAAACVVSVLLVRRAVSRLGGITGDVLGAVVELSMAASLVTAAGFA